jgi:hypothetical protein
MCRWMYGFVNLTTLLLSQVAVSRKSRYQSAQKTTVIFQLLKCQLKQLERVML